MKDGKTERVVELHKLPRLSSRDPDTPDIFPEGFSDLFEIHSFRNAAQVLSTSCKADFDELVSKLMEFRIETQNVVKSGGNKSDIAKAMDILLNPIGWTETRVRADLLVRKIYKKTETYTVKAGKNKGAERETKVTVSDEFLVEDFIDGHKIDFIKGRVAFDLEWNSKDQTFDRDLYAARTFHECGVISAGILLTRSKELVHVFEEISSRVDIKDISKKFGASTTWMGKLLYRLNAGRAGGCPILALGIRPAVISDFEAWKAANPVIREAVVIDPDEPDDDTSIE